MGFLDKLMFWKDDEPEFDSEYAVEGCFTLPDSADGDSPASDKPLGAGAPELSGIDGNPLEG